MRSRDTSGTRPDQQPLLDRSSEDLAHPDSDSVIFSVQDDDEDYAEASALDLPDDADGPKSAHSVRFREEVQVIGPPLRSTAESRETGMWFPRVHTHQERLCIDAVRCRVRT